MLSYIFLVELENAATRIWTGTPLRVKLTRLVFQAYTSKTIVFNFVQYQVMRSRHL